MSQATTANTLLDDRVALRFSGSDARTFLQGQLTHDLEQLKETRSLLAGWTSAKGRLYFISQVAAWRDAIWLIVPAALAGPITKRLQMFVLRSDVRIEVSAAAVLGITGSASPGEGLPDPASLPGTPGACTATGRGCAIRLTGDPARCLLICDQAPPDAGHEIEAWRLADIRAGLPVIEPQNAESFVPQMVNLDLLDGISFDKGCFVGQEIIARTQNLGRIKRRMFRLGGEAGALPAPGDPVFDANGTAGRTVLAANAEGGIELLAVLSLDRHKAPLFADEDRKRPLELLDLPYAVA